MDISACAEDDDALQGEIKSMYELPHKQRIRCHILQALRSETGMMCMNEVEELTEEKRGE